MQPLTFKQLYFLCSPDKDVLNAIEGTHYNYFSSNRFDIQPHFQTNTKEDALRFPYYQALMGDATDNIKGANGVGKVKANKLLEECVTKEDYYTSTLIGFKGDKELMLLNYRLVDMTQFNTGRLLLKNHRDIGGEDV